MADEEKQPESQEQPEKKPEDSPKAEQESAPEDTQELEALRADLKEEVAGEVSQSVISKIGEALGLTKQEEEELPTDPEKLEKLVNDRVEATLKEREAQQQEQVQQTQKERQAQVQQIVDNWHAEYNALARRGQVPEIKDANDPNDPGIKARRNLIKGVGDIIKDEKEQGLPNRTPSLTEAFTAGANREVPGADLPIAGNTPSGSNESFDYKEVSGKSFAELAAEG